MKARLIFLFVLSLQMEAITGKTATFLVTTNADAGPGSLRQAFLDAGGSPGLDTISFGSLTGFVSLASAIEITNDVRLDGPGARQLTIYSHGFFVRSNANATIAGLRFVFGGAATNNGGIFNNQGSLTLRDCDLTSNSGVYAFGGGIYSSGRLSMSGCCIHNILISGTGTEWPFYGCSAVSGGGLYLKGGSASITNSTFSNNRVQDALSCRGSSGGIGVESGNLVLVNCTVTGNSAASSGGIGISSGGSATLINSIITDGMNGVTNVAANNLIVSAADARLGPLQYNGGQTPTHAPTPDSPAIDRGTEIGAPTLDQRGILRPQGRRPDIGAVELEGIPYSFQLDLGTNGPGLVSRIPDKILFESNSMASVMAVAQEDYAFIGWSGDAAGFQNPLPVLMDRDKKITAIFQYSPATVVHPPDSSIVVVNTNSWGLGSFRQAIRDLVASGGGTISFSNVTGAIALPLGLPTFTSNARIIGPGRDNLSLRPPYGVAAFQFNSGITGMVSGLTIEFSAASNRPGGAIFNAGELFLTQMSLRNCSSRTNGGAIFNSGKLRVENCLLTENSAVCGGGIYNDTGGELFLDSTLFAQNASFNSGYDTSPNFRSDIGGGALYSKGTSIIHNCVFSNNRAMASGSASSALGGAIFQAEGKMDVRNSLVCSNSAAGAFGTTWEVGHYSGSGGDANGAGVYIQNGKVGFTNCTFSSNQGIGGDSPPASRYPGGGGSGGGGAVFILGGEVFGVNCTFSGNTIQGGNTGGGGIYFGGFPGGGIPGYGGGIANNHGILHLQNCTISSNLALAGSSGGPVNTNFSYGIGGGIYIANGQIPGVTELLNTIVAGNRRSTHGTSGIVPSDGWGMFHSLGNNLIETFSSLSGFGSTDLYNYNPRLGPLQDNGGPTPTHALLSDSPAIDAGSPATTDFDQRGQPRRIDVASYPNRLGSDGTDIGAVEFDPVLAFVGISQTPAETRLAITSASGSSYFLEIKTNLNDVTWTPLSTRVPGTGGIILLTNSNSSAVRFYRARQQTP